MRRNWTDPFSLDWPLTRIGISVVIGIIVIGFCVGIPWTTYQSLQATITNAMDHPTSQNDQTARLKAEMGNETEVTATHNGWIIEGNDPDEWIRRLAMAPPEVELDQLILTAAPARYVLLLRAKGCNNAGEPH